MLKTKKKKLFETNVNDVNQQVIVDANIILTSASYLQYEQIALDSNLECTLKVH